MPANSLSRLPLPTTDDRITFNEEVVAQVVPCLTLEKLRVEISKYKIFDYVIVCYDLSFAGGILVRVIVS